MGVSLAGEIQSENVLSRIMYYIPGRGDPKRMKVGISWLPEHLYMEDKHQRRNKADIMMTGLMGGRDGASDDWGDPPTDWGVVWRLGCGTERI